jgi:hypothetical protein
MGIAAIRLIGTSIATAIKPPDQPLLAWWRCMHLVSGFLWM